MKQKSAAGQVNNSTCQINIISKTCWSRLLISTPNWHNTILFEWMEHVGAEGEALILLMHNAQ